MDQWQWNGLRSMHYMREVYAQHWRSTRYQIPDDDDEHRPFENYINYVMFQVSAPTTEPTCFSPSQSSQRLRSPPWDAKITMSCTTKGLVRVLVKSLSWAALISTMGMFWNLFSVLFLRTHQSHKWSSSLISPAGSTSHLLRLSQLHID